MKREAKAVLLASFWEEPEEEGPPTGLWVVMEGSTALSDPLPYDEAAKVWKREITLRKGSTITLHKQ